MSECIRMCEYAHVCVNVCDSIYEWICMYVLICICVCAWACVSVTVYVYLNVHEVHECLYMWMCKCVCVCMIFFLSRLSPYFIVAILSSYWALFRYCFPFIRIQGIWCFNSFENINIFFCQNIFLSWGKPFQAPILYCHLYAPFLAAFFDCPCIQFSIPLSLQYNWTIAFIWSVDSFAQVFSLLLPTWENELQ